MGVGDRLIMLENTWFSVISPEGCASILYRDAGKADSAADAMKISPNDLVEMGICDRILEEPLGGAHRDVELMVTRVQQVLLETLQELKVIPSEELVSNRIKRYEAMGAWEG